MTKLSKIQNLKLKASNVKTIWHNLKLETQNPKPLALKLITKPKSFEHENNMAKHLAKTKKHLNGTASRITQNLNLSLTYTDCN